MPIRAAFSEDGAYVVCGSDGGAVFVWDAAPTERTAGKRGGGREALRRDKIVACESFQVRGDVMTGSLPKSSDSRRSRGG